MQTALAILLLVAAGSVHASGLSIKTNENYNMDSRTDQWTAERGTRRKVYVLMDAFQVNVNRHRSASDDDVVTVNPARFQGQPDGSDDTDVTNIIRPVYRQPLRRRLPNQRWRNNVRYQDNSGSDSSDSRDNSDSRDRDESRDKSDKGDRSDNRDRSDTDGGSDSHGSSESSDSDARRYRNRHTNKGRYSEGNGREEYNTRTNGDDVMRASRHQRLISRRQRLISRRQSLTTRRSGRQKVSGADRLHGEVDIEQQAIIYNRHRKNKLYFY